jgi:hypothetical protein
MYDKEVQKCIFGKIINMKFQLQKRKKTTLDPPSTPTPKRIVTMKNKYEGVMSAVNEAESLFLCPAFVYTYDTADGNNNQDEVNVTHLRYDGVV